MVSKFPCKTQILVQRRTASGSSAKYMHWGSQILSRNRKAGTGKYRSRIKAWSGKKSLIGSGHITNPLEWTLVSNLFFSSIKMWSLIFPRVCWDTFFVELIAKQPGSLFNFLFKKSTGLYTLMSDKNLQLFFEVVLQGEKTLDWGIFLVIHD